MIHASNNPFPCSSSESIVSKSLITKKSSNGSTITYTPDADTDASRGAKLLEVLNAASSGDYITVYKGTYETRIPILDGITIEFVDGAELVYNSAGALIYNDGNNGYTMNIVGRGSFKHTGNNTNDGICVKISDNSVLNIEGKSIISEDNICYTILSDLASGGEINSNFDYYQSYDGTFDNADTESVINVHGNYAVSLDNFVLENDGGEINCYVKIIEALNSYPIERASNGIINLYGTHIIAPSGEILAFNSSAAENLNFYNCTGVCDVSNPITDNYTGTIFINSDFYTDSNATLEEKTDKTPVVKKDLVDELSTLNNNLEAQINGNVSKSGDTMTGDLIVESRIGIGTISPSSELDVNGKISLNGFDGLRYDTTSQGLYAGHLAGNNQSRSNAFGFYALRDNTGDNSNGFGYCALQYNTGFNSNGFGYEALRFNTSNYSSGFGFYALRNNGGNNSNGFGYFALRYNQGDNNTAIGHTAGYEDTPLTGKENTFLGYNASYGENTTITNSTAVGANVTLTDSNTVILGNDANVGIGTTSPDEKLHINGKIKATDINFTNLPTSATGLSTGDVWNDGGTLKIVT